MERSAIKKLSDSIKKIIVFRKAKLKHSVKYENHRSLFLFDPNAIIVNDWQRFGLSFKQSEAILKYLAKGGRFGKVEGLQKMCTINEKMCTKLYPYVRIKGGDVDNEIRFTKRIIKYRERIGGFYKKEPLLEVFGLDSVKFEEIKSQISVNASDLKLININTAKLEDFNWHTYIRYKQVNAIIEYRKQHGNYSNIADLNKVAILSRETGGRLAPYLTF